MKLDDQTLQNLLRDVPVPSDLKERLREITKALPLDAGPAAAVAPASNATGRARVSRLNARRWGWAAGLVTTAALCGVIASWPSGPRPGELAPETQAHGIATPSQQIDTPINPLASGPLSADASEMSSALREATGELDRLAQSLEDHLRAAERSESLSRRAVALPALNPTDHVSLEWVIANQTAVEFVPSRDWYLRDLLAAIDRFPESAGAEQARAALPR